MEEADETLWRSLNSSADLDESLSAEESFKSLIRCSDSSDFKSTTATPRKCGKPVEEDLLNALRNLQIASTKKTSAFRSPIMIIEDHQRFVDNSSETDSQIENVTLEFESQEKSVETVILTTNVEIIDKNEAMIPESSTKNEEIGERISDKKSVDENESTSVQFSLVPVERIIEESHEEKSGEETPVLNPREMPVIAPLVLENMKRAMKPLLKPSVKKCTIGVSPMLQTRARSRLPRLSPRQSNSSTTITANRSKFINQEVKRSTSASSKSSASSRSSSLKRQSVKNVVATVVATKEGIKLKEEKINNFGIPVSIVKKKKRTQTVPFSFAARDKKTQEAPKKQPMKDSNALILKKEPAMTRKSTITLSQTAKKFVSNDAINKENTNSTLNRMKSSTAAPKLIAEKRLKERKEFNDKVKEREKEIELMKAKIERKKLEKGKSIELEVRKKIESKGNSIPVFKVPAPVKSGRAVNEPPSPAWALKSKKL